METKRMQVVTLGLAALLITILFPVSVLAQRGQVSPVAPRQELVTSAVKEAYEKYRNETSGKNADYIPCLGAGRFEIVWHRDRHDR